MGLTARIERGEAARIGRHAYGPLAHGPETPASTRVLVILVLGVFAVLAILALLKV